MTNQELQDLIRALNYLREDLHIALREIQDLKDRVDRLEDNG